MRDTRRQFVKLAALATAAVASRPPLAFAARDGSRPARPLRILILGGTGFIGPHQVRYALERGHRLTLFNRGQQPDEWAGEVEALVGDRNVGDLTALQGRQWDVCIDNPTTLPFWVRDAGRVLRGKVGHYMFVSTISAYARNDQPADESAAAAIYTGKDAMAETLESFHAHGELYGPLKAVSEQEAHRQFAGMTTIIRPGLIVGPGDPTDRFTYWPVRLALGGEVLAPGNGADPVQIIDVRDLAAWMIHMAESHTLGTFNATGPERALDMRGLLADIAAATHSAARLIWVSADFLQANDVAMWSDMPVWVPGSGDTAGFARRSIRRALAAGLAFRPLPATAVDTLAWFRQQPLQRQAQLRAGLSAARETALLAKWRSATSPAASPG
jgi:2'-hydroxyisoflavone reductase